MKVAHSLASLRRRSRFCKVVKRRGRTYIICKQNPKLKVRQGRAKMKHKR